MVLAPRWPCFAAVVLASLSATVAKRRPSFRSTCSTSSAAAKTSFREVNESKTFLHFSEVCTIYLDGLYEDLGPIGGAGHVIEVDEMKMGRRKYTRGRVVDSSWILGFIDIETNEVRLEICPENKRDRDTLFALIEKHVALDSCIFTDCWKGYTGLEEHGFQHWTVNHQRQFVTEEGVNTNKIESQWRPLRQRLARGGIKSDKLAEHLCEYLYKKDTIRRNVDVFTDFLEIIKTQFPGR